MELSEYASRDATGLAELIASGAVTAGELHATALVAIGAVDPQINALVHGPFDPPAHDEGGRFRGVPFAVKDTCAVAGWPLGFGTRLLDGFSADHDSTLMQRFSRAGLATLGKTATPEFAANANTAPVVNGQTRNPWNLDRIPGGSSGGAAAIVAAGALPMAHANDGGGSIRIPAAWCGLVGLKPTRGRLPLGPDVGEWLGGYAHEFAVTRTVRDAAALLEATSGPAPGDKYAVPAYAGGGAAAAGLRIAIRTESFWGVPCESEVVAAVEAVGRTLEELGHRVEPAAPRLRTKSFLDANAAVWATGVAAQAHGLGALAGRKPSAELLEAASWALVQKGVETRALELVRADAVQNAVSRSWGTFLEEDYDLFLCPTLPTTAPRVGALDQNDPRYADVRVWMEELFGRLPFTPIFNVTGQPSISLPLAQSEDGLPIGVMLSAAALREDLLLAVAAELEEALPWAGRRPPVHIATG